MAILMCMACARHVQVGRFCQKEIRVLQEMQQLDLAAAELADKIDSKAQYGVATTKEAKLSLLLQAKYTKARARMEELLDEPDIATGHAFIVFHYEADRNKMATLFRDEATRPRLPSPRATAI